MTFIPFSPGWRAGIAAPVFLLAGAVLAQVPDLQAPQPDGRKPRQPVSQSAQQQDELQASANKSQTAAERRFRDMDRRLNRTLRSVCSGC
jgi:predicted lipid-binding transport protein (Tim44 family)